MKRKINWIAIGNMIGLVTSIGEILYYFYKIAIEPFITGKMVEITPFGFIILILAFIVASVNLDYFEERIKK